MRVDLDKLEALEKAQPKRYILDGDPMDVPSFVEWWEHMGQPKHVEIVAQLDLRIEGDSEPYGTCDWGECGEEAVRWRWGDDARGHLPVCLKHDLLAEYRLAGERETALREALVKYGTHAERCSIARFTPLTKCSCGWTKTLAETTLEGRSE